ncbi:MAG: class I SAM-dependent methyltransferase [Thermaerobacter sp.]|nr:class I SAM-dependent methyltransferase [Thermaerobacter sp.]
MNSNSGVRGSSTLDRQFGHPTGLLGWLVGYAMALEHRSLHRAVIDHLALNQDDRVLEIGFGPGTAIRLAALHAAHVSGIDISTEMVRQALHRNHDAVRAGRVDLQKGTASTLPYPDGSFTVVFEVNSFHHWDDQIQGIREIQRVLRSGGKVMFTLRGSHSVPTASEVDGMVRLLEEEGLTVVATEEHSFEHGGAFVVARRA